MLRRRNWKFRTSRALLIASLAGGAVALATGCGEHDSSEEGVQATGTLRMPLTSSSEAGSAFRLRFGSFDVTHLETNEPYPLSTEDSPDSPVVSTVLPTGNYRVELMEGWLMERQEAEGFVQVPATLISEAAQETTIEDGMSSLVVFAFEVEGQVVQLGEGELQIGISVEETVSESPPPVEPEPEAPGLPQSALIETNPEALAGFTLRSALESALLNAGRPGDAETAYGTLIDSFSDLDGQQLFQSHYCGLEFTEDGVPGLNGFPLQCPRIESQQLDQLDQWFPIAAVNRFDLATMDGSSCGQQRLIFASDAPIGNGRMFVILEANIPNPDPECGAGACFPIAAFWNAVSRESDPAVRAERLASAFLTGDEVPGFGAFMDADNLGPEGGQIRTNSFNDSPWTLREFRFDMGPSPVVLPTPVADSPFGELWNDQSTHTAGPGCRDAFLEGIDGLLGDNLASMSFTVPHACRNAESRNDGSEDYAFHLSQGGGVFAEELSFALEGTGLTPTDVAQRARFAGSCIGCHQESSGASLGNGLTAPLRFDFTHVSEREMEPCQEGQQCFALSGALRDHFLPHRAGVLETALESGGMCTSVMSLHTGSSSGASRTLGGQVGGSHAH